MVDFQLSDEQRGIRDLAREFAAKEIAPVAAEYDRSGDYPWDVARKEDTMGQRAGNTAEIVFEEARVPHENLIGGEGRGFKLAMEVFDRTRPPVGALATGIARSAMEHAFRYARERQTFGRPIIDYQAIQFKLADMAMEIAAARHLTWHAAWLGDREGTV